MITVIGGSGFIGTNLCQLLTKHKINFEIIDIKKSRSFPEVTKIADIRDFDALNAAVAGDTIIHLAAVHRDDVRDKRQYYDTNVAGTDNVCRMAVAHSISHIVFTSTVAVYGFTKPDTDERGKINPFNDYGQSKYQGEEVLRDWYAAAEGGSPRTLTIVRPTVVFGEGNRGNVFNLLNQIASGKFIMIGNGQNRKSMAYVGNVSAFLKFLSENPQHSKIYNYVDKPDYDMNTLVSRTMRALDVRASTGWYIPFSLGLLLGYFVDFFAKLSGQSFPISSIRVRKFCATTTFETSVFGSLGFRAPYSLDQGLSRTLETEFLSPDPNREVFFTE